MGSKLLVEFDYKGVEGVLVGYFAKDEEYIEITKLGHGIFASHILGTPIEPLLDSAAGRCADIKRSEPRIYHVAKCIAHGSNYGETPYKIYQDNKKVFESLRKAKELQELYFSTIAKGVRTWQAITLETAHQRHYLQNPFMYRHYFWDIFHPWKKGKDGRRVLGSDAKRALAFLPQSTVAGVICEVLLRLGTGAVAACRLQIHDSLLFELQQDGFLPDKIRFIKGLMERPVDELGGLVLPVEVKVGKNWGEMREYVE